ncbi:cancer-related regulator of actin dynamics [Sarcophilus harrisii]|uniref:cancer-related regulator of actin dynamics n=1 Tax=Sarcophilus harrisii TaxID=9305 RepID=UPI001301E852|nr:cancer-related regulator of actin dynamics [Sarcophilus harrisii]
MGTRAFSHDSIFIPDGGAESEQTVQAVSQDNILGKVKTHQPQLGKNLKFGQSPAPTALPMKRTDTPSPEASLEEDLFLSSPMEIVTHQDLVLSDSENKSSDTSTSLSPLNLPGTGSEMEEKAAPVKSSRPKRHFSSAGTIESINLDAIPRAVARLDNSAAKHKLAVKPKNQRVSKKHRRLSKDQQNDQESFESQLSLDQNGHSGEEKQTWPEEELQPLDSEEEKRQQEEYWRHLEAEYRRQRAEKKRLEEQRLQEVERRLREENPLLEEEEEEEEEKQQPPESQRPGEEERQRPEEPEESGQKEAKQELEGRKSLDSEEQVCGQQEAEKPLEELQRPEGLQEQRKQELEAAQPEEVQPEEAQPEEVQPEEEQPEEAQPEEAQPEEAEPPKEEEEAPLVPELWSREGAEQKEQEPEEQEQKEEGKALEETDEHGRQEAEKERLEDEGKLLGGPKGQDLGVGKQSKHEAEKQLPTGERERTPWEEGQKQDIQGPQKPPQGPETPRQSGAEQCLESQAQGHSKKGPEHEGQERDFEGLQKLEQQMAGSPLLPEEGTRQGHPLKEKKWPQEELAQEEKKEAISLKRDQRGEELRWQEVEERQTMPRPYTFQVSSGGKQILFPKVNLSPVTPGKEARLPGVAQEPEAAQPGQAPHPLPSSLSIPHTAILVTGAQLCGPAVNLHQIKDTACKTLLGLSEEKKLADVSAPESSVRGPPEARAAGGRARLPQEASGGKAAPAEWESIRSRILKTADIGQGGERDPLRQSGESVAKGRRDSRGNLRKTLSANAKFSITPAWQKFSEGGAEGQKQNANNLRNKPGLGPSERAEVPPPADANPRHQKAPERTGTLTADTAEGWKFAKDLPSFLVPSSPLAQPEGAAPSESEAGAPKTEVGLPSGEESAAPFGIKLRRTNYSLRFHSDQPVEQSKKKKRHNAGDIFDGAAPVLKNKDGDKEDVQGTPSPAQERKDEPLHLRDSPDSAPDPGHHPAPPAPLLPGSRSPSMDQDKPGAKSPLPQKPALAPKPASQTPPSSPLSKTGRPFLAELLSRRAAKPEQDAGEKLQGSKDGGELQPPPVPHTEKGKGEEDLAEKKPPSPSVSVYQQEKPDRAFETGKKEKPVLQSWHSLEGSKSMEKPETAQPQWVTLALQKQKGFREQQATREERKQAKEVKQPERVSQNNTRVSQQPESSNITRIGSFHKSTAQEEEKKIETAVSRLERREQLKKSNTLPTSVTVDISDSAMPASLVKEVPKRFSTPDAAPMSTEPAWLALAKRKAKAWSDCPQIIK